MQSKTRKEERTGVSGQRVLGNQKEEEPTMKTRKKGLSITANPTEPEGA